MKKIYLLIVFAFLANISFSQSHLNVDFSDGTVPPTGWTVDEHSTNWRKSMTQHAGSDSPEMMLHYYPVFNGSTKLISSTIDLTGKTLLRMEFKQMLDHYTGTYKIGVSTRSGGGDWNNVWEKDVTASIAAETVNFAIDNSDVGKSDFQICFTFAGNSNNLNAWYIDDIRLFTPYETDASLSKITVPKYNKMGNVPVTAKIQNDGVNALTSFDVNWTLNEGNTHTKNVTGQNLATGDMYDFTADDQMDLQAGEHTLKVWISNVNGSGNDGNQVNDSKETVIQGATESVQRFPLLEEFTSSTCGPCANFNSNFFTAFLNENAGDYTIVKYQMNWPAPGDAYYTEEGGKRKSYYGVSGVPSVFVDGGVVSTSAAGVTNAFTASKAKPAFIKIETGFEIEGNNIKFDASLTPYCNFANVKLYMIVIEKKTTGNTGSNGETEFHYVMMKMVSGGEGTDLNLTAGTAHNVSETIDMSGTKVEEMSDLAVAVFVQAPGTREIFQSAFKKEAGSNAATKDTTTEKEMQIYPNPVKDIFKIKLNDVKGKVKVSISNLIGQNIIQQNFDNNKEIQINTTNLNNGVYLVKINNNGKIYTQKIVVNK